MCHLGATLGKRTVSTVLSAEGVFKNAFGLYQAAKQGVAH